VRPKQLLVFLSCIALVIWVVALTGFLSSFMYEWERYNWRHNSGNVVVLLLLLAGPAALSTWIRLLWNSVPED